MSERKTMFTESALIERDVQTARVAIAEFKDRLTEQGIPIKELLSGEMVAVPRQATYKMHEAGKRQMPVECDYWQENGVLHCEIRPDNKCAQPDEVWEAMVKQAQAAHKEP